MLFDNESPINTESNYLFVHSRGMEPRELLRALMARDGDNPHSLSVKLKGRIKQPQIYKFVTGTAKEPRRSTLAPLAEHYEIPVEAFYDPSTADAMYKRLRLDALPVTGKVVVEEPGMQRELETGEDVVIKQLDTGGRMGVGGIVLHEQPGLIRSFNVTREWVEKNLPYYTSVENLSIVTGFGDSMLGMFNPGDPLIVDRGITKADVDGVYFFCIGDEGFIKRLQRIPGQGVLVISENQKYRDWTITPAMESEFRVLGKVLRAWNGQNL
jgi:hypothetical protein